VTGRETDREKQRGGERKRDGETETLRNIVRLGDRERERETDRQTRKERQSDS
jgi:hypothetical protein